MGKHTVEKIGGTSMSQFGDVMKNIIIGKKTGKELYNRIFVVSAYGGITDLLLEHKKTGEPGVFAKFAAGDKSWISALDEVKSKMIQINTGFADLGLDLEKANEFVNERIEGIRSCLKDLMKLRSFGHLRPVDYLPATRELLSAVGEAHSAYNSVLILQKRGINAIFVDLTGWKEEEVKSFDEEIRTAFKNIDYSNCLPIATGYVKCLEGIMKTFDRGYSDITFSKIAVITGAKEGVIHKEFHLSTGDPKLIGVDKVRTIGATNFDIADQLADLGMEAIHSKASKKMEAANIPIRVKNTFDPADQGTLISRDYVSPAPRVEMICGRKDILAVEVFDSDMVGQSGYDYSLLKYFAEANISYIAKNTNANTITHYIPEKSPGLEKCIEGIKKGFESVSVEVSKVAIVSVIGSNMKIPGFLSRAAKALAQAGVNILALDQCMRQVNMQFIISREDFERAQIALHAELVEKE
ncbi:MAG TPA: aspartate kinase [Victivallales bacterium]|nr:aspartate kinase [Victivallales bacterium]HRR06421.1 aspartate kinase [Victivallales bacterium]HRR29044.1 aspartate kinase [Victivallales bacterium]HRU01977.1 aspartate kinase [Victivallales bacterium]